jgi:hypothetical protein
MGLTLSRFVAGIRQLRAFKCQLLPIAKGADSPKMKLFKAVACLESGLAKFGHALDQSGQAAIHRRFVSFILDDRGIGAYFPTVLGCACLLGLTSASNS